MFNYILKRYHFYTWLSRTYVKMWVMGGEDQKQLQNLFVPV